METITQTRKNHRELTTEEARLAAAEIEERLARYSKAYKTMMRLLAKADAKDWGDTPEEVVEEHYASIRPQAMKDLPEGVELEEDSLTDWITLKKLVYPWVRGQIHPDFMNHISLVLSSYDFVDVPWIFFGIATGDEFQKQWPTPEGAAGSSVDFRGGAPDFWAEFVTIGSRNSAKRECQLSKTVMKEAGEWHFGELLPV